MGAGVRIHQPCIRFAGSLTHQASINLHPPELTVVYIVALVCTLVSAIVLHSVILSVLCIAVQFCAFIWYVRWRCTCVPLSAATRASSGVYATAARTYHPPRLPPSMQVCCILHPLCAAGAGKAAALGISRLRRRMSGQALLHCGPASRLLPRCPAASCICVRAALPCGAPAAVVATHLSAAHPPTCL